MAYSGLDMHDVRWFREVFLELNREMPARETDVIEELRQGRFFGKGRYVSVDANVHPPLAKMLAVRGGRYFLRRADRLVWAWKRKSAANKKGEAE